MSSTPPPPPPQPTISPTLVTSTRHTHHTDSLGNVLSHALESLHNHPELHTHTSRHGVPSSVANTCRDEYKAVIHEVKRRQNVSLLNAFLERQAKQVTDGVNNERVNGDEVDEREAGTEPVTICADLYMTRSTSRHVVTLQPTSSASHCVHLLSIGRMEHNDVCVPMRYGNVSRTHCLVMVVLLQTGPIVFVVDMWSKFGTGLYPSDVLPMDPLTYGGSPFTSACEHLSVPGHYAVLSAPLSLNQPTPVFALGVAQNEAPPLRITFQLQPTVAPQPLPALPVTATCLICMDAPRTEVFETCRHLVGCEACIHKLMLQRNPMCPVCREPVIKEAIRKVRVSDGGENTFVGNSQDCV